MTSDVGLRERKRAQTRRRLEEAAIGLALRDGLDKVTIDAISERADVSRRTFFNYFDSKDDAILGVSPPDVSPETLTRHLARYDGSDLVESIIGLIIAVLGPSIDEPALHQSRLEVIRQHPQLLERMLARMARITEQLTAAASTLIARNGEVSGDQRRLRRGRRNPADDLCRSGEGSHQTMVDDEHRSFPGRTGTTGGIARSRSNREADMTESPRSGRRCRYDATQQQERAQQRWPRSDTSC